jgi:NAD(P)-dependent dehydrogenase (short-subunit alcohol dehydrogenase family)
MHGNTGIGLESAKALAKGGATVVMTARTDQKGIKALETVQEYLKQEGIQNDKVYTVQLDLDDLENVKTFTQRFKDKMGDAKIDVLMNNAGVMAIPERQLTKDGYERTFQSNHLVSG